MEIEYFIKLKKHNNSSQIIIDKNWLQHLKQELKKCIYLIPTVSGHHSLFNLILALTA